MVKRKRAPSGFYTAREAMQRLGLGRSTFFNQVKTGKIIKTLPPTGKEGYYEKKMIDQKAQANALFTLINSIEPITFSRVESEEDLRGIVDLCIDIYGQGGTPSYDARREIWEKNPEVYYIVRQEGVVTGYISLIWFDDEALTSLMGPTQKHSHITSAGTGIYSVTGPEHILTFEEGKPIDSLFISLGVRPGFSNTEQREYAFKLLRGTQDVLANFATRGMPIRMLYATSERGEGIKLAQKLQMEEIKYSGDNVRRYRLEVGKTDTRLLQPYKQALEEYES